MAERSVIKTVIRSLLWSTLPVLLVACGGGSGIQQDTHGSGVISGRLVLPQQSGLGITEVENYAAGQYADVAPIVPGEVLVGFDRGIPLNTAAIRTLSVGEVQLTLKRGRDAIGYHHYSAPDLTVEQTREVIAELNERDDVLEAIPNWILSTYRVPDDPLAYLQWHYPALNLPAAWDIETGHSNRIAVAVVDSGGITDPNLHPDLRFIGGYNFVSGANHGGPNPGWGPDYMDYSHLFPEYPNGGSGFHGLHVAGTIGAITNNAIGLAGVNWNVDLVAVRATGIDGQGSVTDIFNAAFWAGGARIDGVPDNPHPVRIINMSLGGNIDGPCPQLVGEAFQEMARRGVITVVAAGNENMNTATIAPANCPGVITVGAVDHTGSRAPYSNFGPEVDVMAPGGNMTLSFTDTSTGDTFPAGVLSTVLAVDGGNLVPQAQFMEGTSMASPHVAGVISLMLARNPNLTFDQIVTQLKLAGRPLSAAECSLGQPVVNDPMYFCGAGLVDAALALGGSSNPPGTDPPVTDPPVTNPPVAPENPIPAGNVYVAALFTDHNGLFDEYRSVAHTLPVDSAHQLDYVLSGLQPGRYTLVAWRPLGNTELIQRGDPFAVHPFLVNVAQGQQISNLDLYLQPHPGLSSTEHGLTALVTALAN